MHYNYEEPVSLCRYSVEVREAPQELVYWKLRLHYTRSHHFRSYFPSHMPVLSTCAVDILCDLLNVRI